MPHRARALRLAYPFALAIVLGACGSGSAPGGAASTAPSAAPASAAASAAATTDAKALVDGLVAKAKQEGELSATLKSSWGARANGLADAFNKRFGLNLKITITPLTVNTHVAVALSETQAGLPPTYDYLSASDEEASSLLAGKAVVPIADWEALLKAINPAVSSGKVTVDHVSSDPFKGVGMKYLQNLKVMNYNPSQIAKEELPRTHADLADPKYKGKWAMSAFTAHFQWGPVVVQSYDETKWLDTVRKAGQNAKDTLNEAQAYPRTILGEFAFDLGQDGFVRAAKAKDPAAPLANALFTDYNPVNNTWGVIRSGTKHPAAATLWALWLTTQEAESIWQPATEHEASPYLTESKDDQDHQALLKSGGKIIRYGDSKETKDLLAWYLTKDGQTFLTALSKAQRGQ